MVLIDLSLSLEKYHLWVLRLIINPSNNMKAVGPKLICRKQQHHKRITIRVQETLTLFVIKGEELHQTEAIT